MSSLHLAASAAASVRRAGRRSPTRRRPPAWALLVGLAAAAGLLALGQTLGGSPSESIDAASRSKGLTAVPPGHEQAVFDGRGKWGGYAR